MTMSDAAQWIAKAEEDLRLVAHELVLPDEEKRRKKGVRNLFRSTPQGKQVRKHCETKAPLVQQRPEKVPDPFFLQGKPRSPPRKTRQRQKGRDNR